MKVIRKVLVISILLTGGIAVLLWWGLPGFVESRAVERIEERGYQVEEFRVRKVGLGNTRISAGKMEYQGQSLEWEDIGIYYQVGSLMEGRVDRLEIKGPVLNLNFPEFQRPLERADPNPPVDSANAALEVIPQVDAVHEEVTAAEELPFESGEETTVVEDNSSGKVVNREEVPSRWSSAALFGIIRNFPVSEFQAKDGQARLLVPGEHLLAANWDGQVLKSDDLITGEFRLAGNGFSSGLSLNGMESARFFSALGEIKMDLVQSGPLIRELLEKEFGFLELPSFVLPKDLSVEMLVETVPGNSLAASGQASMENMRLDFPEKETYLRIGSIHLAGSAGQWHRMASAGLRFEESIIYGTSASPFGLALSLDQSGRLKAESEEILHRYKNWTAKSAIRGHVFLGEAGHFENGRLEWAFSGIQGPQVELDSFSTLIEFQPDRFNLEISPLGVRRNGTLWIEQAEMYWDLMTQTGKGSLDWYGTSGAFAGSVNTSVSMGRSGISHSSVELFDKKRTSVMDIHYKNTDRLFLDADGQVPVEWINTIGKWWGNLLAGSLDGSAPEIHLSLEGKPPFLKGEAIVGLPYNGFKTDGGIVMEGIQAEGRFLVNMLPRTIKPQSVVMKSIQMGSIRIENLLAEWELPVIHRLQVKQLEGNLGNGKIWMPPFSLNPLNPELDTELFFGGVAAGQVLAWLGEKRFSMDGSLSGSLEIGWRDGIMLVGKGQIRMDSSVTDNRFRFLDAAFVDQYFSSLGSVPIELQERFREALLQEGIRLDELTVILQSAEEKGKVSLRIQLSGESKTEFLEIPIRGLVINNLIPEDDLGEILGIFGPVRMMSSP